MHLARLVLELFVSHFVLRPARARWLVRLVIVVVVLARLALLARLRGSRLGVAWVRTAREQGRGRDEEAKDLKLVCKYVARLVFVSGTCEGALGQRGFFDGIATLPLRTNVRKAPPDLAVLSALVL